MNVKQLARPRATKLIVAGAALFALAAGPCASASVVRINFSGNAGSGYADLTIENDPNASSSYDPTQPVSNPDLSQYDPAGASYITGATGSFGGSTISGIMATTPGTPPSFGSGYENLPASFSWMIPNATPAAGSYDNLFYAGNSPLVCPPQGDPPYAFSGGFLDIFGVVFQLGGDGTPYDGDYLGLWSDGYVPAGAFGTPAGLTFGMNVYAPDGSGGFTLASSQFAGAVAAVPEPSFLWLFGAGVLGLFAWRRTVEVRKRVPCADR